MKLSNFRSVNMKQILTRRRFGQLAIASTAIAGFASLSLANQTSAQTSSNLIIYGARPIPKAKKILLQSLNVATGAVKDLTTVDIEPGEKLNVFTSLADGTLVLAFSPIKGSEKDNNAPRLVFVGERSAKKILNVSGLKKQDGIESLLGANDGSLYGLVIAKNNLPPVHLVSVNRNSGEIRFLEQLILPQSYRFNNLAQCLNGTIYTTTVDELGETGLTRLDLGQGKPVPLATLKFNAESWDSGLSDLLCSPAGQLFALGTSRYGDSNNLYTVNPRDGEMTLLREWEHVTKITVPHA